MDKTDPVRDAVPTARPKAAERGLPFMLAMAIAVAVGLIVDLTADLARGVHRIAGWALILPPVAFVACLKTIMWPYMIPHALTLADAAAPDAAPSFFTYGSVVVLPVIAIRKIAVYPVFRGKAA